MNRTDRLLALVLELRQGGWVQAEVLARTFGVSSRTIYRDILALNEAHVPVVSVPGRGYSLMPGYFLPPLQFTAPEAVLLTLGVDAVRGAFDAEYAEAATSAAKKLLAALPEGRREEVAHLHESLSVVPVDDAPDDGALKLLRRAVLGHHVVTFMYHKPSSAPEERRVFPLGLVHLYGAWLLSAFDPARDAQRAFRLSRMENVQVRAETFSRNPQWRVGPSGGDRRDITVKLLFPLEHQRAVRERPNFYRVAELEIPHGYEVTLQVRDVREILPWVLSWGGNVRVQEPKVLTELVQAEARRMLSVTT